MTFTPKLVALDIDGTLVDGFGHLPREIHEAVQRVVEAGVPVVMSTGRSWLGAKEVRDQLGLPAPGAAEQARVERLRQLTPGDFAAVLRQGRFMPLASAAALVAGLEAECRLKQDGRKAMGFV